MINKATFAAFFAKVEADADAIEDAAEKEIAKGIAAAGKFIRSTAAALAKDPVLLAALQNGFGVAEAAVAAAVETGGTSVLAAAALAEGKNLLVLCGKTAEHEVLPIVTAELHAAVAATTQATPEHPNA